MESPLFAPPFPLPLDRYPDLPGVGLLELLGHRVALVPFNLAATLIFVLALVHTFLAQGIRARGHHRQERLDAQARDAGRTPVPDVAAQVLHLLGEVEVVFGLWGLVLLAAITAFYDWSVAKRYVNEGVDFTEALFVIVIMALASTEPVLTLAERGMRQVARLFGSTPAAWWLSILSLGPLLGSLITEPAAMTISALLLARQFYERRPGRMLAYGTLGLLFVNVSVGGTLTHFAAPPVLMVARPWGYDLWHMASRFGAPAVLGIALSNTLTYLIFRRQLQALAGREPTAPDAPIDTMPGWVIAVNLAFVAWTVANAHYPALFIAGFLFFLGFAQATSVHQRAVDLRAPLLVGFFLAGLVVHGGLQGWWIAPVLKHLGDLPLFFGAAGLTAFNDNALVTYLATLVPGLSDTARHAILAGAVTGGGLTVIANAPNPAGQSLLDRYFEDGISPSGLLLGALGPTAAFAIVFQLLG
jgi:Putative Na+/H+ antiporter